MSDTGIGKLVLIFRIPMIPTVSFTININKSQGQTLVYTEIDIRQSCFS